MKKFSLAILCFMMTLNTFAATAGSEDFIQIFDNYQYAVTVDWDQKDDKRELRMGLPLYRSLKFC